ncbi:MAG: Fe2+-dependent dioxygenase [Flavipsychrobacter sp.]
MQIPSSVIQIQQLIQPNELKVIDELITKINFEDGKNTASGAAKLSKNNLQSSRQPTPEYNKAQELIFKAIAQHPIIQAACMPKNILPPIISRYKVGMEYGMHTDSPVMTNQYTIRVDLSITLFLSPPDSYEGGELVIHTPTGFVPFKLNKGDAIIYPTTRLHCVNPVTKGERVACVTWMQSLVKSTEQRELLLQLKTVQESVGNKNLQSPENLMLLQIYSNLMRMWTDI